MMEGCNKKTATNVSQFFIVKIYVSIVTVNLTVASSSMFSLLRTCALSGRRYVPDFLSGKIEVFQMVFRIDTETGSEPHPFACLPKDSLIAKDSFLGSIRNLQALIPGYTKTFDFRV